MARIGLNISVSGYTGKLLIRWLEASAPLAEVGRSAALDFPYNDVYSINDISPVVHIVQLWRSDDGVALDELIKEWEIDATLYNEATVVTYQYKVGRGQNSGGSPGDGTYWEDPDNLDTDLIDERLDDATKDELVVHEAGYGNHLDAAYELRSGGGITLQDGKTFDQDVAWFITWSRIVTQTVPAATSSSQLYTGVEVVTADQDFDDATTPLANTLVIANKAGSVLTINFPDLATIANDTKVTFNTHNGSQKYLKLQFDTGDTVIFNGAARNVIYLAKGEEISLYFKDAACYVTSYHGRALIRGSVWADMDSSRASDSGAFLLADESTGVLNASDYPGLYEFIENLPASHSVPFGSLSTQWSYSTTVGGVTVYPNKSKYGIDTVAEQFRVPHLKDLHRRFVNTGENPGRYEHDAVGPLGDLEIRDGFGGSATGTIVDKGFSGQDNAGSWVSNGSSGSEKYIRSSGTQNKVRNYGETPFIIL